MLHLGKKRWRPQEKGWPGAPLLASAMVTMIVMAVGGACEPRIPDWKTPSVEEILQVTSVRLDVEQIPLVSEVGLVGSVEIGLKGA